MTIEYKHLELKCILKSTFNSVCLYVIFFSIVCFYFSVMLEYKQTLFSSAQAKYDDIKKVVKAAADGPMKGVLAYTDHQVCA